MSTQKVCWKHGHGPCFGRVARYQPFGSSGKFLYCQAHIDADKQKAERAGTDGWCHCGRPVLTEEALAYRKGLQIRANPAACPIHQPKHGESMAERHRRESERDERLAARDYERDTV